jgi:hypothetical protein
MSGRAPGEVRSPTTRMMRQMEISRCSRLWLTGKCIDPTLSDPGPPTEARDEALKGDMRGDGS